MRYGLRANSLLWVLLQRYVPATTRCLSSDNHDPMPSKVHKPAAKTAAEPQSRDVASPRYQQIADDLLAKLRDGTHPVGSMLPTEVELSGQYGVSRYTVREALRLLEAMGLVDRRQGAGTTVAATDPDERFVHEMTSIDELLQYPENTRLYVISARYVEAGEALAERLGCSQGETWQQIDTVRRVTATAAPICTTTIFVRSEYGGIEDDIGTVPEPVYAQVQKRFDLQLDRVAIDLSAGTVGEARAELLEVEPHAPALLIMRRYLDAKGRIFEVSDSCHPAARFTYRVTLRRYGRGEE